MRKTATIVLQIVVNVARFAETGPVSRAKIAPHVRRIADCATQVVLCPMKAVAMAVAVKPVCASRIHSAVMGLGMRFA